MDFPENTFVQEGEGVLFHVKVTGVPHPNLTWYHNGVEVKADYSRDLTEDSSLSLPSSESKHSGVYRLVALNPAGRAEREVRLTLEEEGQNKSSSGSHVEKNHTRSNKGFKEEYTVWLNFL